MYDAATSSVHFRTVVRDTENCVATLCRDDRMPGQLKACTNLQVSVSLLVHHVMRTIYGCNCILRGHVAPLETQNACLVRPTACALTAPNCTSIQLHSDTWFRTNQGSLTTLAMLSRHSMGVCFSFLCISEPGQSDLSTALEKCY